MLRNDLYTTDLVTENNSVLQVSVKLNAHHPIFKGHFPGQPVLPGVCMLEMIQEIMEEQLRQKLRIKKPGYKVIPPSAKIVVPVI